MVQLYSEMARAVDKELNERERNDFQAEYDPVRGKVVVSDDGKTAREIDPYQLRLKCKCAGCIDEVDGRQILKVEKVPLDVFPTRMMKKGNYAVAVVWSDGHRSSIYPFERLMSKEFV